MSNHASKQRTLSKTSGQKKMIIFHLHCLIVIWIESALNNSLRM